MKINFRMWTFRVIFLLVGLTIAHLGVTLFLQADLGSDPFNVLIQGIFRKNNSLLQIQGYWFWN